jgi:hypothetical protein
VELSGATDNHGTISADAGSNFDNDGTLTIFASGELSGATSGLNNGIIDNNGTLYLEDILVINTRASLNNYGTFTMCPGGTCDDGDGLWNYGTINNYGPLVSDYNVNNYGTFSNFTGGTVTLEQYLGTYYYFIDFCGGVVNGVPGGAGSYFVYQCPVTTTVTITETVTNCQTPSVGAGQFPVSVLDPLLIAALLFPAVVLLRRRFRTSA